MALSGVIFDFDGVIADTESLHLRAYQKTLLDTSLSIERDAYYERYLGYDDIGVFNHVARDHGYTFTTDELTRLIEQKGQHFKALINSTKLLFPGASECIKRLAKETPLAIASGALHDEIENILQDTGLRSHFSAIVASDDVAHSKPAPDTYLEAVKHLTKYKVPDWDSYVAIEDSPWGLEAAHSAGLRSIAVTHSYPATTLTRADIIVDQLSDIDHDVLEKLCG